MILPCEKFNFINKIAEGGTAEVYKVKYKNKIYALKVLKNNFSKTKLYINLFRREAKILSILKHKNIVKFKQFGNCFLLMEYIKGLPLNFLITNALQNKTEISFSVIYNIVFQILEALAYFHKARKNISIVHKDISPSNILFTQNNLIKICDFGISNIIKNGVYYKDKFVAGKISYMSPEQIRLDEVDTRSDIYQLGIVMYELLKLKSIKNIVKEHPIGASIFYIVQQDNNLAAHLRTFLGKCLSPDKTKRFQTALDAKTALKSFFTN
jgi:serine/threonine-protein kinase